MGAVDYKKYIHSEGWRDVKRRFLASSLVKRAPTGQTICFGCHRFGIPMEVHHRTYKRLGKEFLMDLALLCRVCHESVHLCHRANRRDGLWAATNKIIRKGRMKGHPYSV